MSQEYRIPLPGERPVEKSHACLYGCLILGIGMVCMLIMGLMGGYFFYKKTTDYFLDDKPVSLPSLTVSDSEKQAILDRWAAFKEAAAAKSNASITLDTTEVNVILQSMEGLENIGKTAYVTLEGDTIKAEISTEFLPGKYINGLALLSVSIVKGRLVIFLDDLQIKGKSLPDFFMQGLKGENFAKGYENNPQVSEILKHVTEFSVNDSKLTIRLGEESPAGTMV
ncbi:MAG TPA: hypothetical protein PLI09_06275 [Candidatus Hydrogenedentes bacterium]|nr:hypothetical protein [Candidatus Hydrogenedentota bacterium]